MAQRTFISLAALALIGSLTGMFLYLSPEDKPMPLPYETIVLDYEEDESKHLEKEKWIETMHRSAPDDNWRNMDQQHRLQAASQKKQSGDLPIYGKWRELGSNNQAGRTVYTYFDPETEDMYTASDGGQVWKGEIGADNWVPLNDHFKIPRIRFVTKIGTGNNTRLLVQSSAWNIAGIFYSDDDGLSWAMGEGLDNIIDWGFIKRTVVKNDPGKTVYCIAQEWDYSAWQAVSAIYKSNDLGSSFEKIQTFDYPVENVDLWTAPGGESDVFVMAQSEFYLLDESDELVSVASLPNPADGNTLLTGFDSDAGLYFYAMIRFNNMSHFYASGLNGQNWSETGTHTQGPFMVNSFAASPDEMDVLYFGGIEAFTSNDAGQSWTIVNNWGQYYGSPEDRLHADIPAFNSYMVGDMEYLFINTDGGTYISYDKAENVENLSLHNLRISQYYTSYTCRFDPSYVHAGSQDQGYQKSDAGMDEGAIDYDQVISGDYGSMVSGDDGASLWMVYPGFAMYCPNINNSNYLVYTYYVGENIQWLPRLMDNPSDPETAYLAGGHLTTSGAHIIKAERTGGSITYSELPHDFSNGTNANISALAYSPVDHDYWYVLTSERDFFYSTDGGDTWSETEAFEGPGSHYFYGASIAPSRNTLDVVYAGGSGYSSTGVFRSVDNGKTFDEFDDGLPNTLVFQLALSPDDSLLFAATEVGAFVCKTWEGQWYSLADSIIPDQAFWAVDFVDTLQLARFSTYGRGIWDFELDPDVMANFTANSTLIGAGETVDFNDLSAFGPTSWEWHFEGGSPETSTEQHPADILYNEMGAFDVTLVVSNENGSDTLIKEDYIFVGTIGMDEASAAHDLVLYPNPAKGYVFIETAKAVDRINVYSSTGKLYFTIPRPHRSDAGVSIDISGLTTGVFMVEVVSGTERQVRKLIKE